MAMRRTLALLLVVLAPCACRSAPWDASDRVSPLAAYWAGYLDRALGASAVGYAYAIHEQGERVAVGGSGYALVPRGPGDPGQPMTPTTRMQIASVSKTITAVALLRVLEQLAIPVDTSVWTILEGTFEDAGRGVRDITLEQLLSHTSGFDFGYLETPRLQNTRELLARPVPNTPGDRVRYSNINSSLCRTVLEVVSGREYEEYVRSELLEAACAGAMSLDVAADDVTFAFKAGVDPSSGAPIDLDFRDEAGPYGWYATVEELMRFLGLFRRGEYVSREVQERMLAGEMGLFKRGTAAGVAYRHDGQWVIDGNVGVRTALVLFPNEIEAVLFINTNGPFQPGDILLRGFDGCVPRMSHGVEGEIAAIHIEPPAHCDEVRWTADGSEPNVGSKLYRGCIRLPLPTTVRCRGFAAGEPATFVNMLVIQER